MNIRIALEDGFAVSKGTGIGQYTLNLFQQLQKQAVNIQVWLIEKPLLSTIPMKTVRRVMYIIWLNSWLQTMLKRNKINIVHFTNYLTPAFKPANVKYVVTIHDLTAWRFPETLPLTYRSYIKRVITHAVKRADLILTVSNFVKNEIIELLGLNGEKIRTIHNGANELFWRQPRSSVEKIAAVKKKFGIKKEFLLFVGTLEERKNILTLVKALEKLRAYKDLQLVLVGRPGHGFSRVKEYLADHSLKEDVVLTGYVAEEEKVTLYDAASIFVYPSLYEGFGIPLVEAMTRGVPIVASKIPSSEEVAQEAAIYYEPAYDHEALADTILRVLKDQRLRQEIIKKGFRRAQHFSWENIAQKYIQVYQEVLEADET